MLTGHGDDAYRYKSEIIANFSSNVWYGGEPAGLKAHLFSQWETINKYPEVLGESLRNKIAQHHQLTPEQILVSSGTTESIYLIAQAFREGNTTVVIPAFAEYEDACRMHHHQLDFLEWEKLFDHPTFTSRLVFICNPNNPTGYIFEGLPDILSKNPETLFVVDEAFIEFTLSIHSAIPLLDKYKNLLILRSLTKAYTIPGLRLGYIAGAESIIDKLKNSKPPWTVNSLAIEAGNFIFDHYENIQVPFAKLLKEKEVFIEALRKNPVINVYGSHTHFFLAETLCRTATELKDYLIENHQLLIRDASNFRGLGEKHFRIATLDPDQNRLLVVALDTWKNHCS